ncbi:MAG: hypothetical protein JW768_12160 [Chitinispirillaceae bacterium]|nr:hypothetical protein [Chitinispirillaceae bacterium]
MKRDIYNGLYVGTASSVPNINGMRKDVIAAFKECGVSVLDWPGGCFAETYNWSDGIGPKSGRPGGDMKNGMGTHEYFQLCDSLNAPPYITANITSLPAAIMTDWLNYIDSVFPNKLKYWKIGNEPWGGCGSAISISAYISKYRQYKAAIPSKLLGKITRVADGGTADYLYKVTWIDSLLKCEMGSFDAVTLHYYGAFSGSSIGFSVDSFYTRIQIALRLGNTLAIYDSIMARYDPNYTVGLWVDEWGAWYSSLPGKDYPQSTCRDAVIASINLNMFNNRCRRIQMACVAQPVNVIQSLILTENPAQNRIVKTPTFYVYKMYKVHQQATMVPVTLSTPNNQNIPVISTSSSVDSAGKLHISLCNTHATAAHTVTITLNNAPVYASCTGTIVNGTSHNSYNDFGQSENVNIRNFSGATYERNTVTAIIPAHSVVTLELALPVDVSQTSISMPVFFQEMDVTPTGKIKVHYAVAEKLPFSLGLYTVDGRMAAETFKGTLELGRNSICWQPVILEKAARVYIAKFTVNGNVKSRRVFLRQ